MFINELIVINYRSCQNVHIILEKDAPTVLIGINDCGKSTILMAIGLLLDAKPKFNYLTEDRKKDDISNSRINLETYEQIFTQLGLPVLEYKPDQSVIIGRFCLEEHDVNDSNQATISNHLLWAIEKASETSVWLARLFDADAKNHKDVLLTLDDVNEPKQLFKSTSSALTKARKDNGITDQDITNENEKGRFTNLEIIRAIYSKVKLANHWIEYKVDKGIWPEYRYLDWNMSMEQLNQVVNDILTTRIETQINWATKFARRQAQRAQIIVNQELETITNIFVDDIPSIERLKVNVSFPIESKVTDILINKTNCDGDIHLESQGEGIKRQLWFSLLKWKALSSLDEQLKAKRFIWCFDEPETHLYPKAQRDFFEIIRTISRSNVQTILSTHSTIFIDRAKFSNIHKADLISGYTVLSKCCEVEEIYQSLQLKNSDFLFYDHFLVVEGDTEQTLIPMLYQLSKGKQLFSDNIQLINLGGKEKRSNNLRILLNLLQEFRKDADRSVVYIFDRDAIIDFTRTEIERMQNRAFFVGKQDIEDSLCSSIWVRFVNSYYDGTLNITEQEIEEIKNKIPSAKATDRGTRIDPNQKFYKAFSRYVNELARENGLSVVLLPTKGKDQAESIGRLIDRVDLIPMPIR